MLIGALSRVLMPRYLQYTALPLTTFVASSLCCKYGRCAEPYELVVYAGRCKISGVITASAKGPASVIRGGG